MRSPWLTQLNVEVMVHESTSTYYFIYLLSTQRTILQYHRVIFTRARQWHAKSYMNIVLILRLGNLGSSQYFWIIMCVTVLAPHCTTGTIHLPAIGRCQYSTLQMILGDANIPVMICIYFKMQAMTTSVTHMCVCVYMYTQKCTFLQHNVCEVLMIWMAGWKQHSGD